MRHVKLLDTPINAGGQTYYFGTSTNPFNFRGISDRRPMLSAEKLQLIANGGELVLPQSKQTSYEENRQDIAAANKDLARAIQLLGTLPPELLPPQTPSADHLAA